MQPVKCHVCDKADSRCLTWRGEYICPECAVKKLKSERIPAGAYCDKGFDMYIGWVQLVEYSTKTWISPILIVSEAGREWAYSEVSHVVVSGF